VVKKLKPGSLKWPPRVQDKIVAVFRYIRFGDVMINVFWFGLLCLATAPNPDSKSLEGKRPQKEND
jgi:hypothetical protein